MIRIRKTIGLTLFAFFALTTAQAADNAWIGTWKLIVAKSKYVPGPAPKSLTVKFEPNGANGVKVTVDSVTASGETTKHQYTAVYDGKDTPVAGDPTRDTTSLKRLDAFHMEYVNKKDGKIVSIYRESVSKDRKSRTVTQKGKTPQGQAIDNLLVYERE